jgi:hypothetical protein
MATRHENATSENNSAKTSDRNEKGHFLPGVSGNRKGRKPISVEMKEVRELCIVERPANVSCLVRIRDGAKDVWARIEAVKLLLQYSDGKPVTAHTGAPLVNVNLGTFAAPITSVSEAEVVYREICAGRLDASAVTFAPPGRQIEHDEARS